MAASSISLAIQVASSLFQAHTARLQDATNENQAADLLIPAFDADIRAVAANYNSGGWNKAQAVAILNQVDANCYNYLRKQVGKAGTAWDGSGHCTKSCTVGCCLYYNDLHSAIHGPDPAVQGGIVMDGATGLIPQITSGRAGSCYIPEVFPPSDKAYGNYQRAGYNISIVVPPKSVAVKAIQALPPLPEEPSIPVPTIVAATPALPPSQAATAASGTSLLGLLTNTNLVTIVGLVGGILIIIAYLFGSNAVRINR